MGKVDNDGDGARARALRQAGVGDSLAVVPPAANNTRRPSHPTHPVWASLDWEEERGLRSVLLARAWRLFFV